VRCPPAALRRPERDTVALARTGVGPAAAARAVQALPALPISAALCLGFAGGLAPGLAPGTVVVAEPLLDPSGVPVPTPLAPALAEAARRAGLATATGPLLTGSAVVADASAKARLHRAHGALAVDMESAVLSAALGARGVPVAAARVVLDAATESIPARPSDALRHPGRIAAGLRVAWRLRSCGRISARLLEAWLGAHGSEADGQRRAEPRHQGEPQDGHGEHVQVDRHRDVEEHDRAVERRRPER